VPIHFTFSFLSHVHHEARCICHPRLVSRAILYGVSLEDIKSVASLSRILFLRLFGASYFVWELEICGDGSDLSILLVSSCPHDNLTHLSFSFSVASAFVAPSAQQRAPTSLEAERRDFLSGLAAGAVALSPLAANAVRDYENLGYLGGGEIVDINNANVRVYLKMPGLYPSVAGKIASNGPYNSVSEIYNIPGLSGKEKDLMKKYESRFTAKSPSADYVIDRINNGLYR
jgi:photosystem II PsbU protein